MGQRFVTNQTPEQRAAALDFRNRGAADSIRPAMAQIDPFGPLRCTSIALFAAALLASPGTVLAQYKVVQPDGRILYTDVPPVATDARITPMRRQAKTAPPENTLPDALRRVAERYPVTLYTAADCEPCASGRQLLQQRGVPYQERLVIGNEDILALERAVGGRTVPALSIGSQPIRGFSAPEWGAFLDVAGYPRESALPADWKSPPARALVERSAGASLPAAAVRPRPAAPTEPAPSASGGLRF